MQSLYGYGRSAYTSARTAIERLGELPPGTHLPATPGEAIRDDSNRSIAVSISEGPGLYGGIAWRPEDSLFEQSDIIEHLWKTDPCSHLAVQIEGMLLNVDFAMAERTEASPVADALTQDVFERWWPEAVNKIVLHGWASYGTTLKQDIWGTTRVEVPTGADGLGPKRSMPFYTPKRIQELEPFRAVPYLGPPLPTRPAPRIALTYYQGLTPQWLNEDQCDWLPFNARWQQYVGQSLTVAAWDQLIELRNVRHALSVLRETSVPGAMVARFAAKRDTGTGFVESVSKKTAQDAAVQLAEAIRSGGVLAIEGKPGEAVSTGGIAGWVDSVPLPEYLTSPLVAQMYTLLEGAEDRLLGGIYRSMNVVRRTIEEGQYSSRDAAQLLNDVSARGQSGYVRALLDHFNNVMVPRLMEANGFALLDLPKMQVHLQDVQQAETAKAVMGAILTHAAAGRSNIHIGDDRSRVNIGEFLRTQGGLTMEAVEAMPVQPTVAPDAPGLVASRMSSRLSLSRTTDALTPTREKTPLGRATDALKSEYWERRGKAAVELTKWQQAVSAQVFNTYRHPLAPGKATVSALSPSPDPFKVQLRTYYTQAATLAWRQQCEAAHLALVPPLSAEAHNFAENTADAWVADYAGKMLGWAKATGNNATMTHLSADAATQVSGNFVGNVQMGQKAVVTSVDTDLTTVQGFARKSAINTLAMAKHAGR
jgi:hypothetical protein